MLQLHNNCCQAHLKPSFEMNRNAIFEVENLLASIQREREKEFDFLSIRNNKKLEIPSVPVTVLKKYCGTFVLGIAHLCIW